MVLGEIPDWRWFWGTEKQPTLEEAAEMINSFDVSLSSSHGLLLMSYDKNRVATLHIYLAPSCRRSRAVAEMIRSAEDIAKIAGMRKVMAPITEGNPFLRAGKKQKFGYHLEGELKEQVLVDGQPRSLFLYGKLLQQKAPIFKKE